MEVMYGSPCRYLSSESEQITSSSSNEQTPRNQCSTEKSRKHGRKAVKDEVVNQHKTESNKKRTGSDYITRVPKAIIGCRYPFVRFGLQI